MAYICEKGADTRRERSADDSWFFRSRDTEDMKTIQLRDVEIGTGIPKICIPVAAENEEKLLSRIKMANELPCELIEWRADTLANKMYLDLDRMLDLSDQVMRVAAKPVILTIRTSEEGGFAELDRREYYAMIRDLVIDADIDAVDIEAFDEQQGFNAEKIEFLTGMAHSNDKKVILSSHDFSGTPDLDVMVKRLVVMQELGADIPKIAVMAKEEQDALDVLEAARIMQAEYAKVPFIAIAMGAAGMSTRICAGSFGSAITFAAGGDEHGMTASAPGQISAEKLKGYLEQYYQER